MAKERNRLLVLPPYEENMYNQSGSILSLYLLEEFAKKIPLLVGVPDKKGKFYTDGREAYKTVVGDVKFRDVVYKNRYDVSGYKRLAKEDWRMAFHFGSHIPHFTYYDIRNALLKHFAGATIESDIICYVWGEIVNEGKVDQARVVGSHLSPHCHSIFNGPMSKDQHLEIARCYASLSVVKKIEKSPSYWVGIDVDLVDKCIEGTKRNTDGHLFLYGGQIGIDSRKRLRMWLDILKKKKIAGKNVKARIHTFVGEDNKHAIEFKKDYGSFLDLRCDSTREDFLRSCGEANYFVLASTQESFGISFFEMLYAGVTGVIVDRPWMQGIWPNNYPFRANTDTDLYKIISWMIANGYEKCWEKVDFMKSYVRDHYNTREIYSDMADYVLTMMAKAK